MKKCPITAGMPTFNRIEDLRLSLTKILACDPQPDQVIVYVDGGDDATAKFLKSEFPDVEVIDGNKKLGPGGGRNKITAAAKNQIIASFDDDSYPLDSDYFERLEIIFKNFPKAAVVGANIFQVDDPIQDAERTGSWVAGFMGCGCAYRKDAFMDTSGYVELPVSYGMEEADLVLRLYDAGWSTLKTNWLRVFHNNKFEHHASPRITSGGIVNKALLAYLRYPTLYWGFGFAQYLNGILFLLKLRRIRGIAHGIYTTPFVIWKHRSHRKTVSKARFKSHLRLCHNPLPIENFDRCIADD